MPPMVGVPALPRWVSGPSSRTCCPIFSSLSFRDYGRPEDEAYQKRRKHRAREAEGDVAEHVKGVYFVVKGV